MINWLCYHLGYPRTEQDKKKAEFYKTLKRNFLNRGYEIKEWCISHDPINNTLDMNIKFEEDVNYLALKYYLSNKQTIVFKPAWDATKLKPSNNNN